MNTIAIVFLQGNGQSENCGNGSQDRLDSCGCAGIHRERRGGGTRSADGGRHRARCASGPCTVGAVGSSWPWGGTAGGRVGAGLTRSCRPHSDGNGRRFAYRRRNCSRRNDGGTCLDGRHLSRRGSALPDGRNGGDGVRLDRAGLDRSGGRDFCCTPHGRICRGSVRLDSTGLN